MANYRPYHSCLEGHPGPSIDIHPPLQASSLVCSSGAPSSSSQQASFCSDCKKLKESRLEVCKS
ncbi:hypothetical protein F511_02744 [Dorcoceras hygrometricum]|uniref:Uncharacterized protein n=1 Tax=Dorcoceras hygrometricum TaxID=472368 RepID=A0A2Z7DJF0_9LAMI|nr:hypothetical protein F511_02744 [Dorcoceras hygrometricum]